MWQELRTYTLGLCIQMLSQTQEVFVEIYVKIVRPKGESKWLISFFMKLISYEIKIRLAVLQVNMWTDRRTDIVLL